MPERPRPAGSGLDLPSRVHRRAELGEYAQYAASKIGCWTAFDRALRLAEQGEVPGRNVARWRVARDELKSYIEHELWSEEKRCYRQRPDSDALDAGCLLAARRGYADPRGERMNATIDAVRSELSAGGSLLYRYSGMQAEENAFLACSFWCVEALATAHRFDEAAAMMDALAGLATDVGLYAEEMEPSSRSMRGNVPQALTHLALINAAVLFDENLAHARPEPSTRAVSR
jgi:GH15 family glucan-1,4-alpha-glucosidase